MMRIQIGVWICLCCLVASSARGQQREVRIDQIGDVITKWQPQQHLYVKGDLGIGKQQLASLESWLDENGPHWTIVLMRSARNEFYQAIDGRQFRGMDAVEYALGHGLANRTAFGELENPETGETDGAVFVLFLEERKFSYYGSDAQDRRGVGESHWVGELDRPATRAMRSGGRILDAVKNTVTSINSRVDRAINTEKTARQRAVQERERTQRERERVVAELRVEIDDAQRDLLSAVDAAATSLKEACPDAQGELAQPPLAAWRSQLSSASNTLNETNVRATSQQVDSVVAEINGYLDAYAEHQSLDDLIAPIEARIAQRGAGPNGVAKATNDDATKLIALSRVAHAQGDRTIGELLTEADAALDQGDTAVAGENERLRNAALRRRIIRNTVLVSAVLTALAIFALLYFLNRRRRPARQRAQEALEQRQKSVRAAMDGVLKLFERSGEILGSEQNLAQRGYTGTTKELSHRTFDNVDDLLVMSNEVERVMDEARELIYPANPFSKIANMFAGSRYERSVNHISGEPLAFTRDKGLPLVIKRDSQANLSAAGGEEAESISMTFEDVFSAFHDRSKEAFATLDIIENSLLDVNDRLAELQTRINHATEVESQLAEAADNDGYFPIQAFFEQLLPSAQQDYDDADALCSTDPVQAIQQQIARGWRKLTEALSIADAIKQGRSQMFPKLEESAPLLEQLGYDVKWMEENVQALGARADELIATATKQSVAEEAERFGVSVTSLGERAVHSVDLANQLKNELVPSIDRFRENIVTARRDVAKALGISEAESLHEHQHDPDAHLMVAGKQLEAARAALHHGGVKSASEAVEVLQREVSQGQALVDDTLNALREFDRSLLECQHKYESVKEKLPRYTALLADVRHEYAASALVLRAGDPSFPSPTATADSHFADCQELLSDAHHWIGDSVAIQRQGKVLRAAAQLAAIESAVEQADQLLDDIQTHCRLLEATSRENLAALEKIVTHTEGLQDQVRDRRTQRQTITSFEQVVQSLRQSQHDVEVASTDRDPFQNALRLTALAERLDEVDALIVSDRNAHAEATRAVNGAKAELTTAQRHVHQSQTDQLPDSAKVINYQGEIASLASNLDAAELRLNATHEDWHYVDKEAARINAELGVVAGHLRDELQLAQESVDVLRSASEEVFRATRWTGGHGIQITGSPGADELERARQALTAGNYAFMLQMSRAAMQASRQAIQAAEREVLRRRRANERAAEAARRRRRQQQSASRGPSVFGGSSSSGGSWSSGSSSSSSSSGSGFSRSGW